jgi:N-acetylmuramic acid 6-phosphate etherase
MSTEGHDPRFVEMDRWPTRLMVQAMAEGQLAAVASVAAASEAIADAAERAADRLRKGEGRLVYAGAGTSGRVAVQDGVELLPTFGWPWERLSFAVAGGQAALMRAVEDAEDDRAAGAAFVAETNLGAHDVVIGVAASGRTPYTLGVLEMAKARGALTIGLANNPDTAILRVADCGVFLDSGPEPVAGSTRMRAGTAQKVALNLLSTAIMVRLGGVYNGMMVAMRATNAKLRARAIRIVMDVTGGPEQAARDALRTNAGDIRGAILTMVGVTDPNERDARLAAAGGDLRAALEGLEGG